MTIALALLTAGTQLALVVLLAAVVVQMASRGARRPAGAIAAAIGRDALRTAALVATVATCGSLAMSELLHYIPCTLCWVQRAAMYPLVIVLAVAAWTGARFARVLALVLAIPGGLVSAYHVQLERFPEHEVVACTSEVPCTVIWFTELGYITIPVMALTAFMAITVLVTIGGRHGQVSADAASAAG